jgi:UDP-GlcNAc3NAcA epimerase
LRDETEWVETVAAGWNVLTGADTAAILGAVNTFTPPAARPDIYGGAGVADRCVEVLERMAIAGAVHTARIGQAQ